MTYADYIELDNNPLSMTLAFSSKLFVIDSYYNLSYVSRYKMRKTTNLVKYK